MGVLRVRVLGPIEVDVDGRPVDTGGPRQRAVLAQLLVARGEVVSVDRLIDQLWAGEPPPRAIASLQVYVSNLRRLLEPDRPQRAPATLLVSRAPGYALRLDAEAVDAWRFEDRLQQAQRLAPDAPAKAHDLVAEALARWQGPAYAEVADTEWAAPEAARLGELRLVARALAVDLAVRLGRAAEAVPAAEALTTEHPLREDGWRLLALALWSSGRQADALAALRKARAILADELGLDPGPALAELERAILQQRVDVPTPSPPTPDSPFFVGRRRELDRLTALIGTARQSGGVALITGEAGLGKTSLLARIRADLLAGGWTVLVGRCPEVDGAPPAWAWTEALTELVPQSAPSDPETLRPLLDPSSEQGDGDPAGGRFRLHRAVTQWLRTAAPLAVILDDLHRADGETLALLSSAARDLEGAPVLLLAAYRPDEGGDRLAEALAGLARRSPERIALDGLPAGEVAALVAAELGGPADGEMVAALTDRTGGNPFYVRESARLWESEGALVALAEVPEGIRDVLRRRLARLPAPAVSVLRLTAVVGREAEVDVLVGAAEADEDTVVEALETGVEAGLLSEPQPGRVRFAHALVRDTLYADLTRLRRARMHGRVASTLLELRPDRPAALAYHYAHASGPGAAALAVRYGIRAAEQAERRYAHDTAAALLTQALDRAPADDDLRSDLYGRLLRAWLRAGNLHTAREVRQRAIDEARTAGRDDLVIAAFTAWTEPTPWQARPYGWIDTGIVDTLDTLLARTDLDPATRVRLLDALVSELAGEDDARVPAAAAEALALARTAGDRRLVALALTTRLKSSHIDSQVDERETFAVELEPLARDLDLPAFRWYALYSLAASASARGDAPVFRDRLSAAQELARRYRMPEAEAIQSFGDAMLAHVAGRFDESERIYREAAARLAAAGSVHADGFRILATATVRVSQGRLAEMEPELRALASAVPDGRDLHALALVALGRVDEARAARRNLSPLRPDYFMTVFATLRGMAAAAVDAVDEAGPLIELLLPWRDQLPGGLSATLVLQPVAHTLGRLCRLAGREAEARAHFQHAAEVADRWGAHHWAEAARAAAVGHQPESHAPDAGQASS